jgi:hypothetical protein
VAARDVGHSLRDAGYSHRPEGRNFVAWRSCSTRSLTFCST